MVTVYPSETWVIIVWVVGILFQTNKVAEFKEPVAKKAYKTLALQTYSDLKAKIQLPDQDSNYMSKLLSKKLKSSLISISNATAIVNKLLISKELIDSNEVWNLVDYHIEPQ